MVNIYKRRSGLVSYIDGLVQDCSNSSALAMELLQSYTKPSIWSSLLHIIYWEQIVLQKIDDTQV